MEAFFRNTVDPFVTDLGYAPCQMGVGKNDFAWMNQAIFDTLHHSAVVLVDLTGIRPNCFMELGYALGNNQRVIVTCARVPIFPSMPSPSKLSVGANPIHSTLAENVFVLTGSEISTCLPW